LPFVLLLLDYWPLRRFAPTAANRVSIPKRLIIEKIPLFALSATMCLVTFLSQSEVIQPARVVPLSWRIGNALVSYAAYLGQLIFPARLAVVYPYPVNGQPFLEIMLALMVLAAVTAGVIYGRHKRPYLLVGWLWYLGMMAPVIGLVQVGTQARADRYTYLPQIGLCLLLTWTAAEISVSWRHRRRVLGASGAVILAVLIACARVQTAHWRDSESLWTHTLACTSDNAIAESNLGNILFHAGQLDEAVHHFQNALQLQPEYGDAHNGLGFILLQQGRVDEAIAHFEAAVKKRPAFAAAHNNFGMALLQAGRFDEAIVHFQKALETEPSQAESHNNLGYALLRKGQVDEAVAHYQKAIELNPDYAGADNNLAWMLATSPQASIRNGVKAVELAQRANQLSGAGNLVILRTLAAAYAEAGRFPEAIETAGQALRLATAQSNNAWIDALQTEIKLYQAGQPLRDTTEVP